LISHCAEKLWRGVACNARKALGLPVTRALELARKKSRAICGHELIAG
jgi:hypothetical protein